MTDRGNVTHVTKTRILNVKYRAEAKPLGERPGDSYQRTRLMEHIEDVTNAALADGAVPAAGRQR